MTAEVGRRLIDGALAFAGGDYARAVEAILPVRKRPGRIGGSHAQRDIIDLTLIAAAERSGQWSLARALLGERVAARPTPRTKAQYAQALRHTQHDAPSARSRQLLDSVINTLGSSRRRRRHDRCGHATH